MILIVEQVYIFLYAILAGAFAAFLYDILRIKRRAVKTSVIFVSLEDILYWLIIAVLLFLTVYKSNSGQMRGFIFIGNVIGVMLYESLLSGIIIKSSMLIINFIKRILAFLWWVFCYPFKLIFKILSIPVAILLKLIKNLFKLIGRAFRDIFKKADVRGKTRKAAEKVLTLKGRIGGITKMSLHKVLRAKRKPDADNKNKAAKNNSKAKNSTGKRRGKKAKNTEASR